MKIFLINLESRPDRLHAMKRQLNRLNISFDVFKAINGRELDDYTLNFNLLKFKIESGHDLVPGEAGCAWSHISLWQKLMDSNDEYMCILEDDIQITDRLADFLSDINNYNQFDYLKLDEVDPAIVSYLQQDSTLSKNINKPKHLIQRVRNKSYNLVECDLVPYATAGYIISTRAARVFLNSINNMAYPIDLLPRYTFPYTRQGFVFPNIVNHLDPLDSSIAGREFSTNNKPPCSQPIWFIYKIFNFSRLRKFSVLLRKATLSIRHLFNV